MAIMDKPKVTVLMSTYNRPQYLAEAIESVVNQRYQDWELIVLNDGGVDVAEVVAKFADPRIIYVPDDKNRGAARRFNQGLALARGEYVTYLGDDDLFYPNHLEVLAKALDEHPEVALAYSDLYAASSIAERKTGKRYVLDKRISVSRGFNREFMFHYNHVLHVSLMHRLEAAKRVGGFDEKVKVLIEWSLNRRLCFLYDFIHVEEITGEYHMPVFKSDRISVRERRDSESYRHNIRKIRTTFPAEPWSKVEKIDLIYVVDEWGEKLNQHLKEIIDSFDHPFYIKLVNNAPGRTLKEIRTSLGNLLALKNISIINPTTKDGRVAAARQVAKASTAKYLLLVDPALNAVKYPKRIFSSLEYMKENPQYPAIRWQVPEEADSGLFNSLILRDYFLKITHPKHAGQARFQVISFNVVKGFEFDTLYTRFQALRKEGKMEEAAELFDRILKLKDGVPPMQYLIHYLTPLWLHFKKYEALEKELHKLIDRGYRADNLIRLGFVLSWQGRWAEAVTAFKDALAAHGLKDEDFEADCFPFSIKRNLGVLHLFVALGEAYLELGDLGQAAHYYHLASKVRTTSHKPLLGFAKVWLMSGQLDRAEVALQKLPSGESRNDPETHRLLGILCQKRRQLDLAFQCFQKSFELAPNDERTVDPFYFVGSSLGKWEEMYNPLATFAHANPDHAMGLARLAAVCFNLKSDALAKETAQRCLAMDHTNAVARSILNRVEASEAKKAEESKLSTSTVVEVGGLRLDLDSSPISW